MQAVHRWYLRFETVVLGVTGLVLFFVLWEIVGRSMTDQGFLSMPTKVFAAFQRHAGSGQLLSDAKESLTSLGYGFGLASLVGILSGLLIGRYRWVEYTVDPYFWFFYSAPLVAFYPLLIFWLGLGQPTIIALTFLLSVFPIVANVVIGVHDVDRVLIKAAQSFGAKEWQIFTGVVLPASVPAILSGLRLGMGRALIGTIVGEFFGANAGLGFRLADYGARLRTTDLLAYVIAIMIVGVIVTQALQALENRLSVWRSR